MNAPERGFTLLEVMVALFIVALLSVTVSQVVGQRIDIAVSVQDRDLAALCGRELVSRFALERRATGFDARQGELRQGERVCYWRLDLQDSGVPQVYRGHLAFYADEGQQRLLGERPVFLADPR